MTNIDLGKTQITDKVRVSSAAIYYEACFLPARYQIETFIFSDDQSIKTRQIIHGSVMFFDMESIAVKKCIKVHGYIAAGLKEYLSITTPEALL